MFAIPNRWYASHDEKGRFIVSLLLSLSIFTLPISSTAKSIFFPLSILAIVYFPEFRRLFSLIYKKTWNAAILLILSFVVLGCFWSPAPLKDQLFELEKYSKLLYLPFLAIGFYHKKTRQFALYAFLFAMLITCFAALLKSLDVLWLHHSKFDPQRIFRNHIMTGFMMALAAYISALLFYQTKQRVRMVHALFFLMFTYQIFFLNIGRTGYVCYVVLMGLFLIQMLSWRQILFAMVMGLSLMGSLYYLNDTLQLRVNQVYLDWQEYRQGDKDSSIGYRLQFHEYAKQLFLRHPIIGNGTGSFTYHFREENPVPSWGTKLLEPHSQYWLSLAEHGVIGFTLLLFFYVSLLYEALNLKTMRPIAFAIIIPFMLINLSDSLLFYSGTGYLFIALMALCLGENVNAGTKPAIASNTIEDCKGKAVTC